MKHCRRWLSLLLMLGMLLGLTFIATEAADRAVSMSSMAFAERLDRLAPAEEGATLVVQTRSNTALASDYGAKAKAEGFNGWHILTYASKADADAALARFRALPEVEHADPSRRVSLIEPIVNEASAAGVKAEPLSWGAPMVGSPEMKNALAGKSLPTVTVALLDTGLDFDHPYFKENAGRVQRRLGKYYFSADDEGHGTHVAGIILDNSPGNVKITPYKVLDSWGYGNDYDIAAAMCAAADDGADVISMSLGGWGYDGDILSSAVKYAVYQGTSVVVAAGNEADDASGHSPACAPAAVTVAAVNKDASPAYFTNYGDVVDIAAPGGYADRGDRENSINSTTPQFTGALYQRWAGTSMACPFVSAAAATIKSLHPEYTPEDIEKALKDTAGVPKNWDTNYGGGILNSKALLDLPDKPVKNIKLAAGKTRQLELPEGFTATRWKSGNPAAANVDQSGLLTAEKKGTALVTAYGEEENYYYSVTVAWNWWQWILVVVAFGWLWL